MASITSWNATKLAMRKFTELNSGERLGGLVNPKYLLVPPDLEVTAIQVLASENDYLYALSNGVAAPVNVNAQAGLALVRQDAQVCPRCMSCPIPHLAPPLRWLA